MKAKYKTYRKGRRAESLGAVLLRLKGYAIVAQRYKTPFGEIDLIARRGRVLACVEVKYRPQADQGLEAVDRRTQRRITAAAEFFRAHRPDYADFDIRFDILTISPPFLIRHHRHAWYGE